MPRTKRAWRSTRRPVYHNNTGCTTGNNIERKYLRRGTGGKRLCKECNRLNRRGR